MSSDDPRLIKRNDKIKQILRNWFDDPKFVQIYDPTIKNYPGFRFYAEKLNALDKVDTLKRKARGNFFFEDVFEANKYRVLVNWLEAFSFAFRGLNTASLDISRHFLKNAFAGALTTYSFLAWNSLAAQWTSQNQPRPISFWLEAQVLQLAFSPVTALATKLYNPSLCFNSAFAHQFSAGKLAYNAFFALSINLYNSNSTLLNYLYYPSVVISAFCYRAWAMSIQQELLEVGLAKKVSGQSIGDFAGQILQASKSLRSGTELVAIAAFSLLNFAVPIVIPQLKAREEYKAAWLDYIKTDKHFVPTEPKYE